MPDNYGLLLNADDEGGVIEPQARTTRVWSGFLYSAHFFAGGAPVGAGDYPVFVTGLAQAGQGYAAMSSLETNLQASARVPDGESWLLSHLGVCFRPTSAVGGDDVVAALSNMVILFSKRTHERILGPAWFWPGGCGVSGVAATTNPASEFIQASNGIPSAGALTQLQTPIALGSGETFRFILRCVNAFTPAVDQHIYIRAYARAAEVIPD